MNKLRLSRLLCGKSLLCLLMCMFLFSIFSLAQKGGEPKIKFTTQEHDFGKISASGGLSKHSFSVKNVGDAPLIILKTYTSCKCTKISAPRKPIMPGDSAMLQVTYDPKTQSGNFFKSIQVYSNDPEKRTILTIKGEVVK